MLSEVLAARLSWPTFFPIRIPLRHVGLDHDMQSWIEDTIRSATGETVRWPDVARATAGAIPVLILDGFDDLQASSGLHYPDFLL